MSKMTKTFIFSLLFILSFSIDAMENTCKNYSFLENGFNMDNYKQCKALIQKCPNEGVLPDKICVERVVSKNNVCDQFQSLAKALEMPVTVIHAKKKENYTLVNVTFIADGQHQYYLISPKGCMVNTNIDPRTLDNALKEKYKNTEFMIVNWKEPYFQVATDGGQNFFVPLRITDTCLACKVIGFATLKFAFDKQGELLGISLDKFKSSNAKI